VRAVPRACSDCGRPTRNGSKCEEHAGRHYKHPVACRVCGVRGPKSYCAEHDPILGPKTEAERLEQQPWRAGYRDPDYHRERAAARKRAGGCCERCGRSDLKLECDHIVPLSTAKSIEDIHRLNKRENLRFLCLMCHSAKTRRKNLS